MNFMKTVVRWFCAPIMPLYFSGSKASTASTTNNLDNRMFQESGAVGASASGGGTAIVNMIDGGAINAAFGMGEHAIDSVTDFATGALSGAHHTTELALNGALASVDASNAAYKDAAKQVATAYEDAKIGNRSTMMMGAVALGIVGLVMVAKKGREQ